MLSGRRQPIGSLELTYWHAYLRIKDEQDAVGAVRAELNGLGL